MEIIYYELPGGNNMTKRQRKGIGFGISGAAFLLLAVFNLAFAVTPEWVTGMLIPVGILASAFGFVVVLPNTED